MKKYIPLKKRNLETGIPYTPYSENRKTVIFTTKRETNSIANKKRKAGFKVRVITINKSGKKMGYAVYSCKKMVKRMVKRSPMKSSLKSKTKTYKTEDIKFKYPTKTNPSIGGWITEEQAVKLTKNQIATVQKVEKYLNYKWYTELESLFRLYINKINKAKTVDEIDDISFPSEEYIEKTLDKPNTAYRALHDYVKSYNIGKDLTNRIRAKREKLKIQEKTAKNRKKVAIKTAKVIISNEIKNTEEDFSDALRDADISYYNKHILSSKINKDKQELSIITKQTKNKFKILEGVSKHKTLVNILNTKTKELVDVSHDDYFRAVNVQKEEKKRIIRSAGISTKYIEEESEDELVQEIDKIKRMTFAELTSYGKKYGLKRTRTASTMKNKIINYLRNNPDILKSSVKRSVKRRRKK